MAKQAKRVSGRAATKPAKTSKSTKRAGRVAWSKQDLAELKRHSKAKTPVSQVAKAMKRSEGALRQKAYALELALGHRR